MCLQMSAEM